MTNKLLLTSEERRLAKDKGYKAFERDMQKQPLGECLIDEYLEAQLAKVQPEIDRLRERIIYLENTCRLVEADIKAKDCESALYRIGQGLKAVNDGR